MTPDTAPEAITQAQELQSWGLALSTADLDRLYRDSKHDVPPVGSEVRQLVAEVRHRRLTSHSAGEGLRGIIERIRVQATCLEGYAEQNGFSGKAPASVFHWQATHFRDLADELDRAATPPSDAGSTTRSGGEGASPGRYLADRFKWAAPGDQQEDAWLVRFCDRDCGEAIFTGPEAEQEAWAYWERYAPSFNIYVFRLATFATTPSPDASPDSGEGKDDLPVRFETWWATYKHRNRDIAGYALKKVIAFDAFEAASPSPSPAIVKEAGEVDRAHLAAWRAIYGDGDPFLNPEGFDYCCKIADAVLAALSASNAAQVSK